MVGKAFGCLMLVAVMVELVPTLPATVTDSGSATAQCKPELGVTILISK